MLLNQVYAGLQPARAWFLKIDPVRIFCVCVCVCVCVSTPRLLITSGVMRRDMDLIRLVKQVLQLVYSDVVVIVNGRGLGIGIRCRH